jgi:pimeloyl-ACP methyl ester carboxylesterase
MKLVRVTAEDGTRLACWDFGGKGQPVLMLHGTGLHGRCWAPVAELLRKGFRPLALDMRGHGASGRSPGGSYGWDLFATDTLAVLDQMRLAGSTQVVGVGHSAGATALLLAEAARPHSFARLWGWEPIIAVPGIDLTSRKSAELASRARRRRDQFGSPEEARAHFEGRGQFADFAPESLEAFLDGAFVESADGTLRLACDPEDEARMYEAALGHDAWGQLPQVCCPVKLSGGAKSTAVPPGELAPIANRLPAGELSVMPTVTHYGPFEAPAAVAADISTWAAGGG